jgi:CheY-like chemotaxis protein
MAARVLLLQADAQKRLRWRKSLEEDGGVHVIEACDPGEAFIRAPEADALVASPMFGRPDDVPVLIQRLRRSPGTHLPIVVVTSRAYDAARAREAGAALLVDAPPTPQALVNAVRGALSLDRAGRGTVRQPGAPHLSLCA